MSHGNEDLQVLEGLMKEFFEGNTRNERRQEIEGLLNNFKNQKNCWKLCFNYLALTKCQYSSMFCINTVEDIINKQWAGLSWEEKSEIKNLMCVYIMQNHETLSPGLLSKSVKVVVDIGRLDWPHFYPDFFINIIELMKKPDTRYLGLLHLLITSEELIAPREDVSYDRKNELKKLLIHQMPQVFNILFEFLINDIILTNPREGCLILKILTHLFSWVPASEISNEFITIMFKLASDTKNEEPAILALTTINEMLYRHWLLPHYAQIINLTIELSQTLMNPYLSELSLPYLEKYTEFMRLVLPLHLSYSDSKESAEALFSAALSFTMQQPTLIPGLSSCLGIWSDLLDNPQCEKYCDVFLALAPELVHKIQFRFNGKALKLLDDETLDDDGETECKKFIRQCIEIVSKVAEMQPYLVVRSTFEKWEELCAVYAQQLAKLQNQNPDTVVPLLRDLSTFTQIMGYLQIQCSGQNWDEHGLFVLSRLTFQNLLTLNELGVKVQYHCMSPVVKLNFEKMQAEVLASLKSWCYWLPLLRNEDFTATLLDEYLYRVINGCVAYLNVNVPKILQHYSAHVLCTLTTAVRPGNLCELESIRSLLIKRPTHLQLEDQYLVLGTLVNCLILKWPDPDKDIENEIWEQRMESLSAYMSELIAPYLSLSLEYSEESRPLIVSTLQMLQHVIKLYKTEGVKTKAIICYAFQRAVEHTLALYPFFVDDTQINEEILQFFLVTLECLQQQVGVIFTQTAITLFLDSFPREQMPLSVASDKGGALQQLLQILELVVRTPGLSASNVTPKAIGFCIELFDQALTESTSPSVQVFLFQLVNSILLNKWNYFFKDTSDSPLRAKQFLVLMKAIGQSLFLPNIDLFKQNVQYIEKINNKWNLYNQELFRRELHTQFLSALLNILIDRRHSILTDEVATIICDLILADMDYFFNDFLPNFLNTFEKLNSFQRIALLCNFKKDKDTPSMIQNITRLANDLTYYQLSNSNDSEESTST